MAPAHLSPYWSAPFVLMLSAIALLPLGAGHWWESNRRKLIVSLVLGAPVLFYFPLFFRGGGLLLVHTAVEYASFVILLGSLFIISGGIHLSGDLRATPLINTAFLLIGSVLASFMGTTGAAMLLIRPLLNTNAERKHTVHTVIFFIFLVGNIGGLLTPLGDPPLFMGYLYGVPFAWTLGLWKEWLLSVGAVAAVYFLMDLHYYRREPAASLQRDSAETAPLRLHGRINLLLLALVVAAIARVTAAPAREMILIALSAASLLLTDKSVRERNKFTYHPITEVAVLFFGIFLTMAPAIYLLRTRGGELGLAEAWQFFWATGVISSLLDNTPTYVVFFNLAQSLGIKNEIVGMSVEHLTAISLGAVLFGAVTYIGNAPNFMVKAIAEERGLKMPSFFGYMLYSSAVLFPIFVLLTWIWFF